MPTQFQELSFTPASGECQVSGHSVRFERRGNGPPLVLVHGLLGYSFSWRRVLERLAVNREVFALDMPGSGFSDCSAGLDGRLSWAADRLLSFFDAMGISCCDLVGSSYGGTTALFLAAKHPDRIRTLTLVSPANPWSSIGRKRLALLSIPLVARLFPSIARKLKPIQRFAVRRMYGDPERLSAETLVGYSLPLARRGVLEHAVLITQSWYADMAELQDLLTGMPDMPILLVWGSKDRLVNPASAKILQSRLRNSRLVVMEGAGHLPYEECPEEFLSLLNAFLKDHQA
jgi:pimeloyl-ACP methyl ester carboxylesterase